MKYIILNLHADYFNLRQISKNIFLEKLDPLLKYFKFFFYVKIVKLKKKVKNNTIFSIYM